MATFMVMTYEHSSPYHVIISFDEERLNDSLYLGVVAQKNGLEIAHLRFLQVQQTFTLH